MESIYNINDNAAYETEIRALQDTDPASATHILNPLFEKVLNNAHAVKKQAEETTLNLQKNISNLEVSISNEYVTKNDMKTVMEALDEMRNYIEENDINNIKIYDSGWIEARLEESCKVYDNHPASIVQYRRSGNVVQIRGAISPIEGLTISGTEQHLITMLPEGFKPMATEYSMMPIHGNYNYGNWLLRVNGSGEVLYSRAYLNDEGNFPATTGTEYMPFNITFLTNNPHQ